jgi:hypothetical protein
MKIKHALLMVTAALIAAAALLHARPERTAVEARGAASSPAVIVYYFHVTARCATCRLIETYSKEAVERNFAAEIEAGSVEWRPVNVQFPENRRFVRDYKLFTRSVVLAKMRDGKQVEWRNLEKVWDLVGRKSEFVKYIQANVKEYLGAD